MLFIDFIFLLSGLLEISLQHGKKDCIFILNIGFFIGHFVLYQQVSNISFLEKPVKKFSKYFFNLEIHLIFTYQQSRHMTGSCDLLDFRLIKTFTGLIVTRLFFAIFFYLWHVGWACELSNNFFGDVTTNIFPVITKILFFFLFDFFKHMKSIVSKNIIVIVVNGDD